MPGLILFLTGRKQMTLVRNINCDYVDVKKGASRYNIRSYIISDSGWEIFTVILTIQPEKKLKSDYTK